jgi:hypothetical protein
VRCMSTIYDSEDFLARTTAPPLPCGRDKSGPYLTGNELPFFAQYMRTFHVFFRHCLAAKRAAHRRDMLHYIFAQFIM